MTGRVGLHERLWKSKEKSEEATVPSNEEATENHPALGRGERFSRLKANVDCQAVNPTVLSWHVHVTYMLTNDQQIKEVSKLRETAAEYFKPFLGEDPVCQGTDVEPSGRYDNGRLCMIHDHNLTNDTL
eukprot:gene29250-35309_t